MRPSPTFLFLLPLALAGCESALGPFAAVNVVSLTTIGRTLPDAVVSAVTGRDCSIVRLDRGETRYCEPDPVPPAAAGYCTRSLGSVDCWTTPPPGMPPPRQVADAPPLPPQPAPERWPFNRF